MEGGGGGAPTAARAAAEASVTERPASRAWIAASRAVLRRASSPPISLATQSAHRRRLSCATDALVQPLQDHGHPLAAAHAHGLEADPLVPLTEPVEQRAEDSGPGHAEGMPESDRAAVRVELVAARVDADAPRRRDDLGREGFVYLDDVDVVDRHLGTLAGLPVAVDRAEPHELRLEG